MCMCVCVFIYYYEYYFYMVAFIVFIETTYLGFLLQNPCDRQAICITTHVRIHVVFSSILWHGRFYFGRYCVKWMGPPLISQPTREYSKRWSQFMVTTCSHYCSVNVPLVRDEYQIQTEAVATFLPIFGACMISRFIIKVKTFVPLTWSCRSHWTYNDFFFLTRSPISFICVSFNYDPAFGSGKLGHGDMEGVCVMCQHHNKRTWKMHEAIHVTTCGTRCTCVQLYRC